MEPFDYKKNNIVSRNVADEAFLNQYEVDRRSVFVGGLPVDIEEADLRDFLGDCGDILNVKIVHRQNNQRKSRIREVKWSISSRARAELRVFAFVEFSRPDMPDAAVENHVSIGSNNERNKPAISDQNCRLGSHDARRL